MKPRLLLFLFSILICAGFSACKKTIDAPALSNSKIVQYLVPVADGNISGVIDEADRTITVYIPYYYELSVIDPKIVLADGAKLSETIAPVDVLNKTTSYTVTGADKSVTTYKLVIQLQQPTPLTIAEYSSATRIATYNVNSTIGVNGNFYTTDVTKITTYLINRNTKAETKLAAGGFGLKITAGDNGNYGLNSYGIPTTLDTGLYDIKVTKLGLTAQTTYPIRLKYTDPIVVVITAKTLKQGETFTITPASSVFRDFTSFTVTANGQQIQFPVVSYTPTSAVIQVPDTMAPGNYGLVSYVAKFTGFKDYTQTFGLTVTAK